MLPNGHPHVQGVGFVLDGAGCEVSGVVRDLLTQVSQSVRFFAHRFNA